MLEWQLLTLPPDMAVRRPRKSGFQQIWLLQAWAWQSSQAG